MRPRRWAGAVQRPLKLIVRCRDTNAPCQLATLAVLDTLGACQPAYPPPPGYVEACYGPDYGKRLTGLPASFTMRMAATEQHNSGPPYRRS